jgi:large-conductance mechanosensitive channel
MCAGSCHCRDIKLGTRIRVAVGIIMTNAFGNIIQGVNRLQNVLAQAEDDESNTHQADAMQTRRTWAR